MSTARRPLRAIRRRTPNRQPADRALPTDVVAFVAPARSATVQGLARRHGHRTQRQRARLRESVQRHINARYLRLDEANAGLAMLGLDPLHGPGTVRFRLRVAMTVVHEDDETDAAMLCCALDEVRLNWSRPVGVLGEVHVGPPRPHHGSGRRRARTCADLLIAVTVRACPSEDALVAVATSLLYDDLSLLHQFLDIIDAPVVYDAGPSLDTRQASSTIHDDRDDSDWYGGRFEAGDGYLDRASDGRTDGSWDRFLDGPGDGADGDLNDDGDVDWRYPDVDRRANTDVDDESDTDLPRLRRTRRTFPGEWEDPVFATVHSYLGVR